MIAALALRSVMEWHDQEDLRQELWLCLLETYQRYRAHPQDELERLLTRSLRNRAVDFIRSQMRRGHVKNEPSEILDWRVGVRHSPSLGRLFRLLETIREALPSDLQPIFEQLVEPAPEVRQMAEDVWILTQGVDTFHPDEVLVKSEHIADFLGISQATMSRSLRRIRAVVAEVLANWPW